MSKKNLVIESILGIVWSMVALWGVVCFNSYILMNLPLLVRMELSIVLYLIMAVGPLLLMIRAGDTWTDYLFSREKIGAQKTRSQLCIC